MSPSVQEVKYKLDDFCHDPLPLEKSVLLLGPSGIGKTCYALAHFKAPLLVRHLDQLSEFNPHLHDGIVFDDMSFTHIHPEARIHLLDMDFGSHIHIRYTTAYIPQGTKRIFCHNGVPFYDDKVFGYQLEALKRRVLELSLTESLFE